MPWMRSLLVVCWACCSAKAADWPQWLGPHRDGSSAEVVAPWSSPPKVLWRQPVGEGNGSPVVAEGRVFVHGKVRDKNAEEVKAFDANTGQLLWNKTYERAPFKSLYGNGPRGTPSVVQGRVYTYGITGLLTCFEAATGKQLWQLDTLQRFNAKNLFFGMATSPLIEGDRILFNVGGPGAGMVALSKDTGDVLWQTLDDRASYSSPIAFGEGANRQIVFLTQQGLVSLHPSTGQVWWRFPLVDKLLESSTTPVRSGDILFASSITYGSVALRLEMKDGKPSASQLWKREDLTCYFATPVPVGDELYIVTGTKPPAVFNTATLHCIETATGKELWSRPKVGKYHATVLRTGDNKLLLLEEEGNLVLLDPRPDKYREICRAKVCGETWAHPALSNGKLYVRDGKEIICLQLE